MLGNYQASSWFEIVYLKHKVHLVTTSSSLETVYYINHKPYRFVFVVDMDI